MKFEISNAPNASNFPLLKYKYAMNEPFVGGTSATNQWSHDQIAFKRHLALQPGFKNGQPIEPVTKSEEEVRKEREDLWN